MYRTKLKSIIEGHKDTKKICFFRRKKPLRLSAFVASKDGAISQPNKELIALGIGSCLVNNANQKSRVS